MQNLSGHKGSVVCCKVYRNYVLSSGYDKILRIWNAESGILLHSLAGHEHIISSFDISAFRADLDDVLIVSGSWDRHLCVWRFPSKGGIVRQSSLTSLSSKSNNVEGPSNLLLRTISGHKNRIKCVRAIPTAVFDTDIPIDAPRDHFAVSGSDDGMILVWNISQGTQLHTLKGHSHFILQLVVYTLPFLPSVSPEDSPDASALLGCCLASYSSDRTIRLWNLSSGEMKSVLSLTDVTSSVNDESDIAVSSMTLALLAEASLMQLPLYVTAKHHSSPANTATTTKAGGDGNLVPVLVLSDSSNNLSLIDLQGNSGRLLLHIPCRPDSNTSTSNSGSRRIVSITVAAMPNDTSGVCRVLYLTDRGEVGCVNLFEPGVKAVGIKHSLSNAVSVLNVMSHQASSASISNKSSKRSGKHSDAGGNSDYNTFHQMAFGHYTNANPSPTGKSNGGNGGSSGVMGFVVLCGDEGTLRVHSYSSLMRVLDTAALVATATTTKVATPHSTTGSVDTADSFNTSIAAVKLPLLSPAPPRGNVINHRTPTNVTGRSKPAYFVHEDEVSLSEHSLVNSYDAQILHGGVDFEELSEGSINGAAPQGGANAHENEKNFWKSLVGNANYGFNRVKFNGGRKTNTQQQQQVFNAHPQHELNKKLGLGGGGSGLMGSGSVSALRQTNQPSLFQSQQQHHQQNSTDVNSHRTGGSNNSKRQKKNSGRMSHDHLPQMKQAQTAVSTVNSVTHTAAPPVVTMNFETVAGTICYVDEYPVNSNAATSAVGTGVGTSNQNQRRAVLNDDNASVGSISVSHHNHNHRGGGFHNAAYSQQHHEQVMQKHQYQIKHSAPVGAYKALMAQSPTNASVHNGNGNGSSSSYSNSNGGQYGGTGRKVSGGRVVLPMIKGVL